MKHIEIHTAETEREADTLERLGLIEFATEEFCEHCSEAVAYSDYRFLPCAVVLDGETEYLLCMDCLAPVLEPGVF